MDTTLWFHIGEQIGLQLDLPRPARMLRRVYASTYEYYQRPHLDRAAQVCLRIGRFLPHTPPGAKTVNKEFVVAPDYIFWKGSHGRGATEIVGLESEVTHIRHVPYREFGLRMLIPGFRAVGLYVEPLLKYHLARFQGIHLLHGGAVARDGRAIAFFGPNGVHKTRLILSLCRDYGFSFLGDDLIMLAGSQVLPFVEHERVLNARFTQLGRSVNKIRSKLTLAQALLQAAPGSQPNLRIGQASELKMAVFLDRQADASNRLSRTGEEEVHEIGWSNLWQRINGLERAELIKHQARHRQLINCGRLLMAYEFGVPDSHIFRYLLLDDRPEPAGLPDTTCRRVLLPANFSRATTASVHALIQSILGNL